MSTGKFWGHGGSEKNLGTKFQISVPEEKTLPRSSVICVRTELQIWMLSRENESLKIGHMKQTK